MPFNRHKTRLPNPDDALEGRDEPIEVADRHFVLDTAMAPPFPDHTETAMFGMGCFWGAERLFWQREGIYSTQVGYAGGFTPNPTYREVCSGRTGHNEVVRVIYEPELVSYPQLLKIFFENHDPTQGMRQGNDVGTQYRSGIYTYGDEQQHLAQTALENYRRRLADAGYGEVTTELKEAPEFYYAEDYHQQYLAKNPDGYCGLQGTGVSCSIGGDQSS